MNEDLWHSEDKDWMTQRKQEWRHVQKSLGIIGAHVRKKHYKYHKELFFFGKIESDDPDLRYDGGGPPFANAKCFFELWYHPVVSLQAYQEIFDQQTSPNNLLASRRLLFLFQGFEFPQDYGMLGGREELFVKVLLPSYDDKQERTFKGWEKTYPLCFPPDELAHMFLGGASVLFPDSQKYNINPYQPGQYLWDHVAHNLPHMTNEDYLSRIVRAVYRIKNHEHLKDFPHNYPVAVNLAKRLKARLDARDFAEPLLKLYDKTETL